MTCNTDSEVRDFAAKTFRNNIYPTHEACVQLGLVCERSRFYLLCTKEWRKANGIPVTGSRWNRVIHDNGYCSPCNRKAPEPEPKPLKLRPEPGSIAELRDEYWRKWHRRRLGLCVPWEGISCTC